MAIVERSVRKGVVDLIPTCVFTSKNSEISQSTRLEIAKGVSHIQDTSKVRREENQSGNQADASKRLRNDSTKEVKIERDIIVNANVVNRKDVSNVKQTDTVSKTKDKSLHSPNVKKSSTSNSINSVSKNKESTGKNQEENSSDKVAGGNCSSIRTSIARNETVNNESNSCKGTKINSEVSRKNVKDDKSCTGDAVGEKDVKTGSSKIKHSSLQDGVSDNSIIKSPAGINSQERKLDKDKSTSVKLKENACDKIDTNGRVSDIKGKDEMKNKTNPIDKAFIVKNKDNVVEKTEACDKTKIKTKNSSEEKSTLSSVKGGSIQVKNNISDKISTLEKITNKNPAKMPDKSIPLDKVSIARSKFSSADKSPLSSKVTASKSKDNEKDKAGTNDDQTSINSNAVHNNVTTKVGDQSKNFGSEKVSPVRNKDNLNDKVDTTEKTSARINKDKEEKSDKTSVAKIKDNLKDKGSRLDNLTNSMSKDNIKESLCNNNKTTSKNKDNSNDKDPPNDKKRLKGKMNTQDVDSSGTKMSTLKSKDIVQNKIDNSDKSSTLKDKGSVQEKVAIAKFSDEKSKNTVEEKGSKMSNVKIKEDVRNKMGSAEKSPVSKEKSDPENIKSKDSLLEKSNKSEKDDKNDSQKKIETKDKKGEKLSNLKSDENMDKRITVDKKKGKCNDQDRLAAATADKTSTVKSKQNILDKSGSFENAVKGKEYIKDKGSSNEKSIKDKGDTQKVKSNDKALSKGGDQSTDKVTDKSKDHTLNKYNSNEKPQKEVKDKMSHTEEISAKFSRSTQEKNSHVNKMAKCNDSVQDKCCFEEKTTKDSVLNKVGSAEKTEVRNKDAAKDDVTLTGKLKIKDKVVKDDSVAKTATKSKEYSTNKLSNKDSTKDIPNSNVSSATKSKDTEVKTTTNEKPSADVDKIGTKINIQDKCDVQDKIGTRNTDDKSIKKRESDKVSSVQSNDVQVNTQATSKVKKTKEEKNVEEKSLNKDRVQNETGLTINKISSIKDNLQNVKSIDDNALTIIYRSDNSEENTTKKTGVINLLTDKTSECTKFKDCPDKNKESQHKTQQNNCDITKTDTDRNINKDAPTKMKRDDIDGGSSDNLVDETHSGRIKNNRDNRPSSYPSIYYKNEFPVLQQRSFSQQGLSSVETPNQHHAIAPYRPWIMPNPDFRTSLSR
ncbi:enolase-phosphatase E1-like [Centruroides vittatus]|uniref:enolase-phosphatase E1-like n=1 Tax=Centruroides vittatus TaxID=120091 RepID=UPI00350EDA0E